MFSQMLHNLKKFDKVFKNWKPTRFLSEAGMENSVYAVKRFATYNKKKIKSIPILSKCPFNAFITSL